MLDPVSAVGLASAIVTFVDFSAKLITNSREIYYSATGELKEHVTKYQILEDLGLLCNRVVDEKGGVYDKKLKELASLCEEEAAALTSLLESFDVAPGSHRKWASFCKAFREARKQGKLHDIQKRLERIEKAINTHLIHILRCAFQVIAY